MITPIKDLMTVENNYTIKVLDNVEISREIDPINNSDPFKDVGGRFEILFTDIGAIYQFDYNKAPKYMRNIVDSSLKSAATQIKQKFDIK